MNSKPDLLIVGGGLGGVAAALAALRLGRKVVLTEETDWLGGQLTTQAVPPDEHRWIEKTGCTSSYRLLRDKIRSYYLRNYPHLINVTENKSFNPGMAKVSRISHEPRVSLAVLEEMLAPYSSNGQLKVILHHRPISVELNRDYIKSITLQNIETGIPLSLEAKYFIDSTELGELLPLANVEHIVGAESQNQTGELHALAGISNPLDQQAITWCFAIDYLPNEDHTIEKPEEYDFWRNYQASFWPGPQLGWTYVHPITHQPNQRYLFDGSTDRKHAEDFWHFRRILYRKHYLKDFFSSDITIVNWPQNDYWLGPIVGVTDNERKKHLWEAKQLSLSLLYWMQTEAPRNDGGYGYPGLRLRPEVVGTEDGFAKCVYVRESRRIQAEFTVLEQHIGVEARGNLIGAEEFFDSVGIGSYRIDLHPSTANRSYIDISCWPFQIPLGAIIPVRIENLLPGAKNIGVTHITNGCYRLHPVEWNIGEVSGALAAYCCDKKLVPRQIRNQLKYLSDFQKVITNILDIQLEWPRYIRKQFL
jgi:hypothetical protein